MKIVPLILFASLSLCARNMSLGPFNNPEYNTQEEQLKKQQKEQKLQQEQEEQQLQQFNQRQTQLKTEAIAREKERKEQAKQRLKEQERLHQEKIKEQRGIKEQIQKNLSNARIEQEHKKRYDEEQKQARMILQTSQDTNKSDYLTLTPEQADLTQNNPDDIETELVNINRLRYILLNSDKTPESIKEYIRFLHALNKDYDLDFAFSYRGTAQAELDSSTLGGGGKHDMIMRYTPVETTHIALQVEGYNQIGEYSSSEFKDEFGALANTSATYRQDSFHVSELWVQQNVLDFIFRIGKIDSSSFFDSHLYKSNSRFFFNSTFSSSPYNAYPSNGLGLAARYVQDDYYLSAEITDANAASNNLDNTFFSEGEFYQALEFGATPADGSKYHLTAWCKDEAHVKKTPQAQGVIASFAHTLDADTHLIIRAALSEHAAAKRYASVGLGKSSVFKEHDISGLAIGTLEPSRDKERTQTTIESFYRIDPIPGLQVSADLQCIYHPSRGDQTWAILPGLRLRVLF